MERFEPPKGTRDLYGQEIKIKKYIERQFERLLFTHGFDMIEVPIFENTNLFNRGVGSGSDVVNKEMYDFLDKGGRSIALRPEFTAGMVRSLISNKLYATKPLPIKFGYHGPAFRYERPQKGRYRQFHQLGVEIFNNDTYFDTYEVISLSLHLLQELDLDTKAVVRINHLGDQEMVKRYKADLHDYFATHIEHMCGDCQRRFETNILRILDCKVPADRLIIEKAPKITDYLSAEQQEELALMAEALEHENVEVRLDPYLVRGLDYYTGIVFEIINDEDGLALGGGGQYAHLVQELGGPDLKGVGMSFGLDRLINLFSAHLASQNVDLFGETGYNFAVLPLSNRKIENLYAFQIASELRRYGYRSYVDTQGSNLGKKLARAEKNLVQMAIILGQDELDRGVINVKNLKTQQQHEIKIDDNGQMFEELFNLHLVAFTDEEDHLINEEEA